MGNQFIYARSPNSTIALTQNLFVDFPVIYELFPFLFLTVLTVFILNPRLHVGHFHLHTSFECCRDYQSVTRVAMIRFCNKIAETMLQNFH